MKKLFLLLFSLLLIINCSRDNDDSSDSFVAVMPPETQTGANTFGVTIKGKIYVPRDPIGFSTMPNGKGVTFWGSPDNYSYNELEVIDGASDAGFKMVIHIQKLQELGKAIYVLQKSNFQNGIDSVDKTHIYFSVWDDKIKNYAYYGSIENQGEINIKRFDGSLTSNWIFSGTFKGKFVRKDNPEEIIEITDGRFDFNLNTLPNHPFP
jgi:hypothetical protein